MNHPFNLKICTVTPLDLHTPSPEMKELVEAVERIVDYKFKNRRLLEEALTHPSYTKAVSYKRLAFMGDAVLGLAVTKYLYDAYPEIDQGDLTRLRDANVSTEKFARVAVRRKLYDYLRPGTAPDVVDQVRKFIEVVNGEDQEKALVYRGSMKAPKVLADIVESVAAAIYVDLNFDLEEFWTKFRPVLEPIVTLEHVQEEPEPITELFHVCQKKGMHPDIQVLRHETESIVRVYVADQFVSSDSSEDQVSAKVNAAKIALRKLTQLMCINDPSVEVIGRIDGSFHIEGAKHKLQNLCAKMKWPKLIYNIEQVEGSSHEKKFVSRVQIETIDGVLCMTGAEKSRVKDAENSAASLMIGALQESNYICSNPSERCTNELHQFNMESLP